MSNKPVYLLLAVLFLVALISFYVSRQALKTVIAPKEEKLQEAISPEIAVESPQVSIPPAPVYGAGITIVKKPQTQPESGTAELDSKEEKARKHRSYASSVAGGVEESTSETAPGPVNVKNRPTPEKIKELNSRGIIIY